MKLTDIEDALNAAAELDLDATPESHSVWFTKTGPREGKLTVARKRPRGVHPTLTVRIGKHPEMETRTQDERERVALAWAKRHGMMAR